MKWQHFVAMKTVQRKSFSEFQYGYYDYLLLHQRYHQDGVDKEKSRGLQKKK